jgi:hypothetical protein
MKKLHSTALLVALAISGQATHAVVRSSEAKAPNLPEIWEKAGPRERLKATRAAELDADRLLVERIYGAQIDSNSTVADLAMSDDSIAATAKASLVGATTIGEPEYFDDGRVEVVKAVKIEQVIETIRRKTKEKLLANGTLGTVAFDEKTELAREGKVLEVQGNAALPGSLGHQRVMAKRAAELDAYRRLAQRLMDIRIDSQTTVRDACLESDDLVASLSHLIKGAEPTAIRYLDDGTCEVEMKITKQDIVRAVSKSDKGKTHTTRIEDSIQEKSYVETGRGSMHPPEPADDSPVAEAELILPTPSTPSPRSTASNDVFFETETIIRRLLDSKPVQR